MDAARNGSQVAIIAGCRTPFSRAGSELKSFSAVDLARHATVELLHRAELDGKLVDQMYFGQVVPSPLAPNLAREVSLLPQFPRTIPAVTVNRACSSANTAIAQAHDQIALGNARVVIAGGGETLGQSAEKMAKINGITRDAQDRFALRSHQLAFAGQQDGRLLQEIAPVYP